MHLTPLQLHSIDELTLHGFIYFVDYDDGRGRRVAMFHQDKPFKFAVVSPLGEVNTIPLKRYLTTL